MKPRFATLLIAAGALLLGATAAQAGRRCETAKPTPQVIERGLNLAQRTAAALDAAHARDGTRVVLLARAGQDLTRYSQHWSHVAWAYRTPEGPWRVVHKLNECGTDQSIITRQGLGEFFLDDLWRYEAAWAVPTPEVQTRLLALLQDTPRAVRLHSKPYSLVSYAWATKYQQSNQWAIETLAAAMESGVDSRAQAQAWLKFKGYTPTTLKIGPMTRLGARVTKANVAFDDHPNEKRFSDRIETITVDSIFSWLQKAQLAGAPVQLVLK